VVALSWPAASVPRWWHHLVEEHRDVHGAGLGHAIVALPSAVVLVPLPQLAVKGRLGVDLELVHVDRLAEQLLQRPDEARVAAEQAERLVIGVRRERRARRAGGLAPHLLAVRVVDRFGLGAQQRHLLLGEAAGQHQIAQLVELLELLGAKLHRILLLVGSSAVFCLLPPDTRSWRQRGQRTPGAIGG
jgi:hypothetical protein